MTEHKERFLPFCLCTPWTSQDWTILLGKYRGRHSYFVMQQIINNLRLQNSSFHQFSLTKRYFQPDFSLLCIIPFQISTASQPYFMERTCHVSNCVKNLTHNVENGWMHKFICLMNDDLVGKRGCFSINKIHLLTIISLHFFFIKKMLNI